jgi:hypothetical protein
VEVGQRIPEELAAATKGSFSSSEQAGMSRDGVQSLRQLMMSKSMIKGSSWALTPANVKSLVIKLRDGADPVRMSARKYAPPQLKYMSNKKRELEELKLVYKNSEGE